VKPVCSELSWRLAVQSGPPGGSEITEGSQGLVRLAAGVAPPDGTCSEGNFMVLCAWWYATPARRSGSWQRLAARVPRQAIYTAAALSFDYELVIYSASSDALGVGLLVFLELWLGIGVKRVVFLELWLGITSLELWLGMADEHEEPLSCGSGWQVLLV